MNLFKAIIAWKNRFIEGIIHKLFIGSWSQSLNLKLSENLTSAKSLINLPNIFSYLRGLMIIPLWILIINEFYFSALSVFFVGVILDFLDGPISRALGCASEFGKFLDPLMDKLIFFTVLIAFYQLINPIIFFSLVITESFLIIHPGIKLFIEKKISGANVYGKYKMTVQTIAIITLLINPSSALIVLSTNILLAIASTLSILSFYGHLKNLTA
jgi:CDP-diacylglycerol--glycerol-3-phosphate 3-phosphatidyltransferase